MSSSALAPMWTSPINEIAELTHSFITLSYNIVCAIFFYFSNPLSVVAYRLSGAGVDWLSVESVGGICLVLVVAFRLSCAGFRFSGFAVFGCCWFLVVGCQLCRVSLLIVCVGWCSVCKKKMIMIQCWPSPISFGVAIITVIIMLGDGQPTIITAF